MHPKLSVVIPARNEQSCIGDCIKHLREQTDPPDEVIVVDNASEDHTAAIARTSQARVLRENRRGMIPARNRGFNEAYGDILAKTDADSRPPPDWIARIREHFTENNTDAVSGPLTFHDIPGRHAALYAAHACSFRLLAGTPPLLGANYALTHSMWLRIRDEVCPNERIVHEDIDMAFHIRDAGGHITWNPLLCVPTSCRRFRLHPFAYLRQYPVTTIRTCLSHPDRRPRHTRKKTAIRS